MLCFQSWGQSQVSVESWKAVTQVHPREGSEEGAVQSGEGTDEAQMECIRMFQMKARLIPLEEGKVSMRLVTQWGTQGNPRMS